jgi:hypothetical protein
VAKRLVALGSKLMCRDDRSAAVMVHLRRCYRGLYSPRTMRDVHVMDSLSHGKTGNPGGAERRPAYCVSWRRWIRLPSVRISGLIVQESGYCIDCWRESASQRKSSHRK